VVKVQDLQQPLPEGTPNTAVELVEVTPPFQLTLLAEHQYMAAVVVDLVGVQLQQL
jgi:hypothetical protein